MATKTKTADRPGAEITALRETLKQAIYKELGTLPELLASLEPEKRVESLIKLMPYVFPKVESVYMKAGEPEYEANNFFT